MAGATPLQWDRQIRQRLARGEESALGELYDRFASLVHHLANKIMDNPVAAEEVTREVFGYLWEHPDAYDPRRGPLRSWMATVTHRQAVRRLRQTASGGAHSPDEVEARVRAASTAARADYIVSSMPEPLRQAFELTYHRKHSYRQAAAELGVSADEARRRLRLGLQMLSTASDDPEGRP